jgi:hypothetical protein
MTIFGGSAAAGTGRGIGPGSLSVGMQLDWTEAIQVANGEVSPAIRTGFQLSAPRSAPMHLPARRATSPEAFVRERCVSR